MRMCIGCRETTAKANLLRLVGRGATVVPDLRAVLDGRGAYLHQDTDCLTLATRKRAFARALRIDGPVDVTEVMQFLGSTITTPSVSTRSAG